MSKTTSQGSNVIVPAHRRKPASERVSLSALNSASYRADLKAGALLSSWSGKRILN